MQQLHLSNQYSVRFNPKTFVNKYQLVNSDGIPYDPEDCKEKVKLNKEVLNQQLNRFVMMGNILYTVTATQHQEITMVDCCAKLLGRISADQPEYLNLLSRFFKIIMNKQEKLVKIGSKAQKMFSPQEAVNVQQQNLTIWPGFECILTQNKTTRDVCLTIDLAFKILRQKTVLQEMVVLRDLNKLDTLVGQIIMSTYNKKFYRVEKIDVNMTPLSTFKKGKTGTEITFAEYYQKRYNLNIAITQQPLLLVSSRDMKTNNLEKVYLVPELCTVTGLTDEMKNNFHCMKAIAQTTKPAPHLRIEKAKEFISRIKLEGKEILDQWGIEINNCPIDLPEAYIPPGSLMMGRSSLIDIRKSNLDHETQRPMFLNGSMARWVVFYTERDIQQAQNFLNEINKANQEYQFGLMDPLVKVIRDGRNIDSWEQQIAQVVEQAKGPQNIHFFLFILPGPKKKAPLYKDIKYLCINKYPVPSQVIQFETIRSGKGLRSICNKLFVQIVSKTGGIPWAIDSIPPVFSESPTMIIGYDFFKGTTGKPGHMAMCSTFERTFGKYYSQTEIMIDSSGAQVMEKLFKNSIDNFKVNNQNISPQNVIIYRDGAGEGQEASIINSELPPLQTVADERKIALIFILVNKRINTKFYSPSYDNPHPGFVVSNKITDEKREFFLISQKTREGTVTPTHYKILFNKLEENGPENLHLQIRVLTFKLCYLYYNFTGSIKYPAPIRYANCLCNFIGERYDANSKQPFVPNESLVKRNTLYYI